jgi:epoxyqueuosine reductase
MGVNKSVLHQIKTEAKRLGFLQIGTTFATTPHHFNQFQDWIAEGFHGNMTYLQRHDLLEKRKNPIKLFRDAISLISLIYPYHPTKPSEFKDPLCGQVAAFALMEDYHTVLQQKAEHLCEFISAILHKRIKYKVCVDSSPILEREFAVQSGIGWIGKNGNLISPTFGSFVLLCEILINISLPISGPFEKDFCGKCNCCVDACPTQCIQNNRSIDSRQCISYLTIENPAEIPNDLCQKMGDWIFGCDICQWVCPWNKKILENAQFQSVELFNPQIKTNLLDEILMTEDGFEEKYKRTPIIRAKYLSYKRNLIIAMGNSQNPIFLPSIKKFLDDPYFQSYAKWAVRCISG